MSAAQQDRFLKSFRAAAAHIDAAPNAIAFAISALTELYEVYGPQVHRAAAAAPFYAEHGENHAVHLGEVAHDLITHSFLQGKVPGSRWDIRALLLAYASFLFHDIGMSIPPMGATFETMARDQAVRHNHDERSLEFVENKLVAHHGDFPAWATFWKNKDLAGPWPSPQGKFAFIVLARVCKSHGDDPAIWLQERSLDQYKFRTQEIILDFRKEWNDGWDEIIDTIYAAATLLSICDLCELGPERFIDTSPDWSELVLPSKPIQRSWSLMHLMSHQIASVSFGRDGIHAKISGYSGNGWAFLVALYCGAVSDLLMWGNKPILVERARQYLSPEFKGVAVTRSVNADDVWQSIGRRLGDPEFLDCWSMRDINESLLIEEGADAFSPHQAMAMIYMCLSHSLLQDVEPSDQYYFYRMVLYLMAQGLVIDLLVAIEEPSGDQRCFDIVVDNRDDLDRRLTRFVSAFGVVRHIIHRHQGERYTVRFACHGSASFRSLLKGGFGNCTNTIFLCEVRDPQPGDIDNYRAIANAVARSASGVFVIFIGLGIKEAHPELQTQVDTLRISSIPGGLRPFAANKGNSISGENEDIQIKLLRTHGDENESEALSVGELLLELWRRGAGIDGFVSSINRGMQDASTQGYWRAASNLALVTLIDVMAGPTPILVERVRVEYARFRSRFGGGLLAEWDDLARSLPDEMYNENRDRLLVPPGLLEGTDLQPDARLGGRGWLMQLVAWGAIHDGNLFNPQSEAARGVPVSSEAARAAVGHILDAAAEDVGTIRLGISMADFLGRHLVREDLDFEWFSALFPKAEFAMTIQHCLAFQMAYRVARHALDGEKIDCRLTPPAAMSVLLGVLEAACRKVRSLGAVPADIGDVINRMLKAVEAAKGPKKRCASIVAFDILCKYGADEPSLLVYCAWFVQPRLALRWGELALLFQGKRDYPVDTSLLKIDGCQEWIQFRKNFKRVLEYTDVELRRNAPPSAAVRPLKAIGGGIS